MSKPEKPTDAKKKRQKSHGRELFEALLFALLLALAIRQFALQLFKIPTRSMEPTLLGNLDYGDRVISAMWYNRNSRVRWPFPAKPERWNILVFDHYEKGKSINFIKRLIGLPGETVEIRDGDIWVKPPGGDRFAIARKPAGVQEQVWIKLCDLDMREPWKLPFYWSATPPALNPKGEAAAASSAGAEWRFENGALVGASTAETPAALVWNKDRGIDDRFIRLTVKAAACPDPKCKTRFKAVFDTARPVAFCPKCRAPVWGVRDDGQRGLLAANDNSQNDYWLEKRVEFGAGGEVLTEGVNPSDVPDVRLALDFEARGAGELEVVLTGRSEDHRLLLPLGPPVDGEAREAKLRPARGGERSAGFAPGPGRHHLEVANVDGVFSAALDGRPLGRVEYEPAAGHGRSGAALRLKDGAGASITNLRLDRDLYYTFTMPTAAPWHRLETDPDAKRSRIALGTGDRPDEREYYFLGDNTLASQDGRVFGPKKESDIIARAIFVAWPPSRIHWVWGGGGGDGVESP